MSNKTQINHELSSISRYMGLVCSKCVLLVLLALIYYPMRLTPGYIFIAALILPPIYGIMSDASSKPDGGPEKLILSNTAKKYRFTALKYKSEKFGYAATLVMLLAWQAGVSINDAYPMPLYIVPSLLVAIYAATRVAAGIFFKRKINRDFINLNAL